MREMKKNCFFCIFYSADLIRVTNDSRPCCCILILLGRRINKLSFADLSLAPHFRTHNNSVVLLDCCCYCARASRTMSNFWNDLFSQPTGAPTSASNPKPDAPEKIVAQKDDLINQLTERIKGLKSDLSMIHFA